MLVTIKVHKTKEEIYYDKPKETIKKKKKPLKKKKKKKKERE